MSIFDIFKKLEQDKQAAKNTPVEYIICGLGNPGDKYEFTRHNVGFMVVDMLCEKYNVSCKKIKFKSLTGEVVIGGKKCLLIKPTTFMNLSGQAVAEAMAFYKISAENVLVIFDDVSLNVGDIRIRRKGSHGGHNGMKNIIYLTGVDNFPRIKIGVGKKPHPSFDLADWVLSSFKKEEGKSLEQGLEKAVESVPLLALGEVDSAMNKFNS